MFSKFFIKSLRHRIKERSFLRKLHFKNNIKKTHENFWIHTGKNIDILNWSSATLLRLIFFINFNLLLLSNTAKFVLKLPFKIIDILLGFTFEITKAAIKVISDLKTIYYAIAIFSFLILALPIIYFLSFYLLLSAPADNNNKNFLLSLHQYRTAIMVRDSNDMLVGAMNNNRSAPIHPDAYHINDSGKKISLIDWNWGDDSQPAHYRKSYNRESSLYVEQVPKFFWDVVKSREHKELSFEDTNFIQGTWNRSYKGVDIIALPAKLLTGNSGGGSTLMNQIIKNLYGEAYFNIRQNISIECEFLYYLLPFKYSKKLCRKYIEYRAARDLFPYLSAHNGKEFKRWAAMHVGLVGRVGGHQGTLYGLTSASAIIFAKKPTELTYIQQAFLASSYKKPTKFIHPSNLSKNEYIDKNKTDGWDKSFHYANKKNENTVTELEKIISILNKKINIINCEKNDPREKCIVLKRKKNEARIIKTWIERYQAAIHFASKLSDTSAVPKEVSQCFSHKSELKQKNIFANCKRMNEVLTAPTLPAIPKDLATYFKKDKHDKQIKDYANLHTRLRKFMGGELYIINRELRQLLNKESTTISKIKLSLSTKDNYNFKSNINNILANIEKKYSFYSRLDYSSIDSKNKKDFASIRISVANEKGEVVAYYLREIISPLESKGSLVSDRAIASISKIPVFFTLLNNGINPDTLLCNQYYNKRSNAGGDVGVKDCSVKVSLLQTIARSRNLPLRFALNKYFDQPQLQQLYSDFNLKKSNNPNDTLVDALSFGTARTTVANTHNIIHYASKAVDSFDKAYPIHAIKEVSGISYDENLQTTKVNSLEGFFKNSKNPFEKYVTMNNREALNTLLSSPITQASGTLRFTKKHNIPLIYGKTGTMDTDPLKKDGMVVEKRSLKDKYVVGVLNINNRKFSFSILIGSDKNQGNALIKKISTEQLMLPVIQEIVSTLQKNEI